MATTTKEQRTAIKAELNTVQNQLAETLEMLCIRLDAEGKSKECDAIGRLLNTINNGFQTARFEIGL